MTAQCAGRCAICSRKMAGQSRSTTVQRPSSLPIVPVAKGACWSMPGCPGWVGSRCCSGSRARVAGWRPSDHRPGRRADGGRGDEGGAADFIEKPIRRDELFARIERALEPTRDSAKLWVQRDAASTRLAGLTARQRQIMELVLAGGDLLEVFREIGLGEGHDAVRSAP
jgi:hypothetical protein